MSKSKNKNILESIAQTNFRGLSKEGIISAMLKQEVAGQRVFYVWLKQNGYDIDPESMDKNQSDGIVKNAIIECKLNENEGGGVKKAYQELYAIIPERLKSKGERLPFYRIYVELETFLVEVYDCHCKLVDTFDWYDNSDKFSKYFYNDSETFEYDLLDEHVDLVEVIQNFYKIFSIKTKKEAYKKLEEGVIGWFKPFNIEKNNINRLILNNDKMNEKYVQKMEGAYFTPSKYVKISTKYVMNAISQSKKEGYDDFVIVDRCAGVGNLQSQFDESIYSHMILGTINEAEAFTANIRFGGLSEVIVIDSLSEDGVNFYKKEIEKYKQKNNVKKLAVIFLENPPYLQLNSNKKGGINYKTGSKYVKTWIHQQLEYVGQDLDEQFVCSAFKYYDIFSYIHYGPIKIWKTPPHLIDKEVKEAYLCNRKYFNAGVSSIALIHWSSKNKRNDQIKFDSDFGSCIIKKVFKTISELYKDDGKKDGICIVEARNYSFASPRLTSSINDDGRYGNKWIKSENLLKVLPLFCVGRDEICEKGEKIEYKIKKDNGDILTESSIDYREIDTTYKTGDGGIKYQSDKKFLQNCLLYSLCTHYNQCSSNCAIWEFGTSKLSNQLKKTEIWNIYNSLVNETGVNGLYNIESFNKLEFGKLWREHNLYPKVSELKKLLQEFYNKEIRSDMIKYELLK